MQPIMGHYDTGSAIEAEARIERVRVVGYGFWAGITQDPCARQVETPRCMNFPFKVSKLAKIPRIPFTYNSLVLVLITALIFYAKLSIKQTTSSSHCLLKCSNQPRSRLNRGWGKTASVRAFQLCPDLYSMHTAMAGLYVKTALESSNLRQRTLKSSKIRFPKATKDIRVVGGFFSITTYQGEGGYPII